MKLSDMKSADRVLAEQLKDQSFREEWDRTALARAVATQVVTCRAQQGLSQAALARKLGVSQPLVARLPDYRVANHRPKRPVALLGNRLPRARQSWGAKLPEGIPANHSAPGKLSHGPSGG